MSAENKGKIRRRKSYKLAEEVHGILTDALTGDSEKLESIFNILDREMLWGSQTNANYAKESLQLFIEDKENGIDDEKDDTNEQQQ